MKLKTLATIPLAAVVLAGVFSPASIKATDKREAEKRREKPAIEFPKDRAGKPRAEIRSYLSDEILRGKAQAEFDLNADEITSRDPHKIAEILGFLSVSQKDKDRKDGLAGEIVGDYVVDSGSDYRRWGVTDSVPEEIFPMRVGDRVKEKGKKVIISFSDGPPSPEAEKLLTAHGAIYEGSQFVMSRERFLALVPDLEIVPVIEGARYTITGVDGGEFSKVVPKKILRDFGRDAMVWYGVDNYFLARYEGGEALYTGAGGRYFDHDFTSGRVSLKGALAGGILRELPSWTTVDLRINGTSGLNPVSEFGPLDVKASFDPKGYWVASDIKAKDALVLAENPDVEFVFYDFDMEPQTRNVLRGNLGRLLSPSSTEREDRPQG